MEDDYFYQFLIEDKNNETCYFKYFADKGFCSNEQDIKDFEQDLINEMDLLNCKYVSQGYLKS